MGVTRGLALAAIERAKAFEAHLDAADGIEGLALDAEVCWIMINGCCTRWESVLVRTEYSGASEKTRSQFRFT